MDRDELAAIVREELSRLLGELRPSSVELYQNAKGERTVTVKEYATSAAQAYELARATFDRAVRDLHAIGRD